MSDYKATGAQLRIPPFQKGRTWEQFILYVLAKDRGRIATDAEIREWYAAREAEKAAAEAASQAVKAVRKKRRAA